MSKSPGEISSFTVKLTIAVILTVLALAAILLHIFIPSWNREIEFAAVVIGGAAAVYAAYYTAISLRLSVTLTRDRNTFDLLKELNRIDVTRIRLEIKHKLSAENLTAKDVHEKILADSELLGAVNTLLGLFEDMSLAVQYDHVNEEILYYSLLFLVPWTFDTLKPFINE